MPSLCVVQHDFDARVMMSGGTVIHASKLAKKGQAWGRYASMACGLYCYVHPIGGCGSLTGKLLDKRAKITCKSCLRVLAADDVVNAASCAKMFGVVTMDGLYLASKSNKFVADIRDARMLKTFEAAEKLIMVRAGFRQKNISNAPLLSYTQMMNQEPRFGRMWDFDDYEEVFERNENLSVFEINVSEGAKTDHV
jgi:hypothetical protein